MGEHDETDRNGAQAVQCGDVRGEHGTVAVLRIHGGQHTDAVWQRRGGFHPSYSLVASADHCSGRPAPH
ncbi:hypothetical protein GCM10009810_19470 [Nostocoides vanveenii]|uniref:Uncharacterized protein n=1 Tax=Nostocoides vanveenii TaxID=330835 RepID=A0ABP4WU22_9MICO